VEQIIELEDGQQFTVETDEPLKPEDLEGVDFDAILAGGEGSVFDFPGQKRTEDVPFKPQHNAFDKDLKSMETILPNIGDTPRNFMIQVEGNNPKPHDDGAGFTTIGIGHKLTPKELETGKLSIGEEEIEWKKGLTQVQMNTLFEEDFSSYWDVAGDLIERSGLGHVPNMQTSLASLMFNSSSKEDPEAGFKKVAPEAYNALLRGDLEAFKFQAFDAESGIVRVGDKVFRGLVNRRRAELELLSPTRGIERAQVGPAAVIGGLSSAADFPPTKATEREVTPLSPDVDLGDEIVGDLPTPESAAEFDKHLGELATALNPITGAKEAVEGSTQITESFKKGDFRGMAEGLAAMLVGIAGTVGGPSGKSGKAGKPMLKLIQGGGKTTPPDPPILKVYEGGAPTPAQEAAALAHKEQLDEAARIIDDALAGADKKKVKDALRVVEGDLPSPLEVARGRKALSEMDEATLGPLKTAEEIKYDKAVSEQRLKKIADKSNKEFIDDILRRGGTTKDVARFKQILKEDRAAKTLRMKAREAEERTKDKISKLIERIKKKGDKPPILPAGIAGTVAGEKALEGLETDDLIKGQQGADVLGATHIVVSGDTLGKIARDNNTTVANLMSANPQIKDANKIGIGDQIDIPIHKPEGILETIGAPDTVVSKNGKRDFKRTAENVGKALDMDLGDEVIGDKKTTLGYSGGLFQLAPYASWVVAANFLTGYKGIIDEGVLRGKELENLTEITLGRIEKGQNKITYASYGDPSKPGYQSDIALSPSVKRALKPTLGAAYIVKHKGKILIADEYDMPMDKKVLKALGTTEKKLRDASFIKKMEYVLGVNDKKKGLPAVGSRGKVHRFGELFGPREGDTLSQRYTLGTFEDLKLEEKDIKNVPTLEDHEKRLLKEGRLNPDNVIALETPFDMPIGGA